MKTDKKMMVLIYKQPKQETYLRLIIPKKEYQQRKAAYRILTEEVLDQIQAQAGMKTHQQSMEDNPEVAEVLQRQQERILEAELELVEAAEVEPESEEAQPMTKERVGKVLLQILHPMEEPVWD